LQAKSGKGARHSLQGGRAIADKYEKRVNTKGVGGAMHLLKFNAQEAFQDEQLALKEAQKASLLIHCCPLSVSGCLRCLGVERGTVGVMFRV
jgi:hypothetical protein